jgi:Domain of unknown function (DUF6754)
MVDIVSLGLVGLAAFLLLVLSRLRRRSTSRLRLIPGLTRLYRAFGLSVEGGTRILVSLGSPNVLSRDFGASLAGLALLREVSQKASASDRPPLAVSGEASLALLSQDSLHAGYGAIGASEYFQPETGRLAGLTPFSMAAGTMPMLGDEQVSAVALIGHFGIESALLAEAADRSNAFIVGSSAGPAAQAALFATASEVLVGEELFAAPAYFAGDNSASAGLTVQDALRWLIVIGLCVGVALVILGVL